MSLAFSRAVEGKSPRNSQQEIRLLVAVLVLDVATTSHTFLLCLRTTFEFKSRPHGKAPPHFTTTTILIFSPMFLPVANDSEGGYLESHLLDVFGNVCML